MLDLYSLYRALNKDFWKHFQYKFPKMRGGAKAVWNFSENSSVLVAGPFPKDE